MDTEGNYANKAGAKIPPTGQPGRVINNKEGMTHPGKQLPHTGHDVGKANSAGFRSVAAKSMMR